MAGPEKKSQVITEEERLIIAYHETGHALYNLGLPEKWKYQPVGDALGTVVHESQSLFWENRIARSRSFSERFWPYFAKEGAPLKCGLDLWHAKAQAVLLFPASPAGPSRGDAKDQGVPKINVVWE